jgi:curved DNA-binding protein CbpA
MKTPFEVLEVDEMAGDEAIKRAYLQKVREHPPERDPERFQAIRAAFEAVADHRRRLGYQLFHRELPDVTVLLESLAKARPRRRPQEALLLQVLAASLRKR